MIEPFNYKIHDNIYNQNNDQPQQQNKGVVM